MYKKPISLICFVFVLGLFLSSTAEAVDPDLLVWYKFDETAGDTASDSSGNGNDGVLMGDPQWTALGQLGGALDFDGAGDYVEDADGEDYLNGLSALTVSVWIKSRSASTNRGFIIGMQPDDGDTSITMRYDSGGASGGGTNLLKMAVSTTGDTGDGQQLESSNNSQTTDWCHVCMTWAIDTQIKFYIDGDLDTPTWSQSVDDPPITTGTTSQNTTFIVGRGGKDNTTASEGWDGLIDDVQIYNRVLTETEIEKIMLGAVYEATAPNPADGAEDVSVETNITWTRGDGAKWDQVYFGTDPCDANLTLVATIPDFQAAEYDPGDPNLRPSTTYYWYINEVNGIVEHNSLPPWSFTTIPGEAQCQHPGDGAVIPGDPYPPTPTILYTELVFSPGPTAVKHTGYLSKVRDKVANRAEDANLGSPPLGHYSGYEYKYFAGHPAFYPFEGLIRGQIYYWTVDETDSFGNVYPGDVWEFAVQ
ncbi:MAG: LamG-like jellyroll fold domain-containing protein, partial [Planctomycetota bacterium]